MAHPKRKISKTRRDKRRTHYKASSAQIATDKTTGQDHLYHRAHWHEGKLYYRGKVLADTTEENEQFTSKFFPLMIWHIRMPLFCIIHFH